MSALRGPILEEHPDAVLGSILMVLYPMALGAGRADPNILDSFNRASMESAWDASGAQDDIAASPAARGENADASVAVEDVTASDGSLPGGMQPEQLQALANDPEVMAMLRNPKMQEVLREVCGPRPAWARHLTLPTNAPSSVPVDFAWLWYFVDHVSVGNSLLASDLISLGYGKWPRGVTDQIQRRCRSS